MKLEEVVDKYECDGCHAIVRKASGGEVPEGWTIIGFSTGDVRAVELEEDSSFDICSRACALLIVQNYFDARNGHKRKQDAGFVHSGDYDPDEVTFRQEHDG